MTRASFAIAVTRVGLALALAVASAALATRASAQAAAPASSGRRTENVILVTLDGVRWQEIFGGADPALLDEEHGGCKDVALVKKLAWRETAEERRALLMPFLWTTVAREGQLWGNVAKASEVRVENGLEFSYPGYNELLAGFPDPALDSNDKRTNPNASVLEWLAAKPGFHGHVAAFASWEVMGWILPRHDGKDSGWYVNAGVAPVLGEEASERLATIDQLAQEITPPLDEVRQDALTFHAALEYWKMRAPRVLYLSLDETDDYAHQRRYDRVLQTLHTSDAWLRALWESAQALPQYQGRTTLLVTTDHGRGATAKDWTDHGKDTPGDERIWLAAIGPDTPPLGERTGVEPIAQGQMAATLAALLGEDYRASVPRAAGPIEGIVRR